MNVANPHQSDQPKSPPSTRPSRGESVTLDKSGARVRDMFRQIAPRYDMLNHLLSLNIDRYWRRRAVNSLRLTDKLPILDVCCGTGDLAIAIADLASKDTQVIGTDFCFDMLAIARQKESKRSTTGQLNSNRRAVPFLEADSMNLPFADNQFQCVTVAFGLRNVAETERGLSEMNRVCAPGGQVMVLEFSSPTMPGLKHIYQLYFRHILPRIGQWLARNDRSAYEYLPASVSQFPSGEALCEMMRSVGLKNVRATPLTLGVVTIYDGTKEERAGN